MSPFRSSKQIHRSSGTFMFAGHGPSIGVFLGPPILCRFNGAACCRRWNSTDKKHVVHTCHSACCAEQPLSLHLSVCFLQCLRQRVKTKWVGLTCIFSERPFLRFGRITMHCTNTQAFPWIMNPPEHVSNVWYISIHMTLKPSLLNSPTQSPCQLWSLVKSCWSTLPMLGTGGHGLRSIKGSFNSTWNGAFAKCHGSHCSTHHQHKSGKNFAQLHLSQCFQCQGGWEMNTSSFAARRRNKGRWPILTRWHGNSKLLTRCKSYHPTLGPCLHKTQWCGSHKSSCWFQLRWLLHHLIFHSNRFVRFDYFKSDAICKIESNAGAKGRNEKDMSNGQDLQTVHEQKPCNLGLLANSNRVSSLSFQDQITKNRLPLNTRNSHESTISWNH